MTRNSRRIWICLTILVVITVVMGVCGSHLPAWLLTGCMIVYVIIFWICCEVMGASTEGIFRRKKQGDAESRLE